MSVFMKDPVHTVEKITVSAVMSNAHEESLSFCKLSKKLIVVFGGNNDEDDFL